METNIIKLETIIANEELKQFSHDLFFLISEKKDNIKLIFLLARKILNIAIQILNSPKYCICKKCEFVLEDGNLVLDLEDQKIVILEELSKYHPCTQALLEEINDQFTIAYFGKTKF